MFDRSSAAPLNVADLVKQLQARGIAVPAAVQPALDLLERVTARRPPEVSPTAIREAYLRDASDDEIRTRLLDDLAAQRLRSEHGQAVIAAATAVLAAVIDHADSDVFVPLREQAQAAIAKLEKIAAIPASETVDGLLRAGRFDDARLLADAKGVAAELDSCFRLRDQFLIRGGPKATSVNSFYCGVWRDPVEAAKHARGQTSADQYVAGVRGGCQLWFPDAGEARELAQQFADRAAKAAERAKAAQHGVGASFTSW